LVQDMIEVMTSAGARLCGRRGENRAMRAVAAAGRVLGEAA